jgi:ParB/RepB/Spo0J family partition protein
VNAPEGGILLQQPTIPLAAIVVSKTNPRKTIDKVKLDELTANVKLKGIINPILVRPIKSGLYEVVAGERRFKAAKGAGLAEIPATVKELTDAEALELQVIENNQREDLHPLEEAEGYEALLKCKHADGSKYTVDDIAAKVGQVAATCIRSSSSARAAPRCARRSTTARSTSRRPCSSRVSRP